MANRVEGPAIASLARSSTRWMGWALWRESWSLQRLTGQKSSTRRCFDQADSIGFCTLHRLTAAPGCKCFSIGPSECPLLRMQILASLPI